VQGHFASTPSTALP